LWSSATFTAFSDFTIVVVDILSIMKKFICLFNAISTTVAVLLRRSPDYIAEERRG